MRVKLLSNIFVRLLYSDNEDGLFFKITLTFIYKFLKPHYYQSNCDLCMYCQSFTCVKLNYLTWTFRETPSVSYLVVPPDQVHPVSIPHDEPHQSTESIWSEFGLDFFLISLEKAKKLSPKSDLPCSFSVRIWSETEKQSWCSTWLELYVKKELMKEKHTSMLKKIKLRRSIISKFTLNLPYALHI